MKKLFKYIENLWVGPDGKPSLLRVMAMAVCINMLSNMSHAVRKWDSGHSLSDLAMAMGVEAGLVASLLGLTTYSNIQHKIIEKGKVDTPDNP